MVSNTKPKGYLVLKKLNPPAKLIGLYYNTFFIFVMLAAIIVMVSSSKGFKGFGIGILIVIAIYFGLFFYQTKYGPKKVAKMVNDFTEPIHYLKIRTSIKKRY